MAEVKIARFMGTAEFTSFVMRCWTVLEGNEPTRPEWDIFKKDEQNVIAIVSTPSLVYKFLNRALQLDRHPTDRRLPFLSLEHGPVTYGKQDVDHVNISDVVPFAKRTSFGGQREYRFVAAYAEPPVIDSFIFCAGVDYMEQRDGKCLSNFVNPEISPKNKEQLLTTLLEASAGYGDFEGERLCSLIANGDLLF
jgi:hypothetical protein